MTDQMFRDLGRVFHEWYKNDKLKFIYGTEGRNLNTEIERASRLVEYVKHKKKALACVSCSVK